MYVFPTKKGPAARKQRSSAKQRRREVLRGKVELPSTLSSTYFILCLLIITLLWNACLFLVNQSHVRHSSDHSGLVLPQKSLEFTDIDRNNLPNPRSRNHMERIEKYESPITPDEEEEEEESDEDEQERFSPEENEDHGNNDDDGDDEEEEENIKSENDDATIDQTSNKETTDKAERLWYGRAMRSQLVDPRKLPISVVLSYCLGDLDWLIDYLSDFEFQSFTVVSKCGVPPNVEHLPEGAEVIQMSNVGRIDHTIAHWMAEVLPATKHFANTKKEEIIIFMKDNVMIHTTVTLRSMETMLNIASADGFACALEPIRRKSFFHMTDALGNFYMDDYTGVIGRKNRPEGNPNDRKVVFKSQYQNMAGWLHDMGILQPRPLVPVCYGGIFAVTKSQISQVPHEIWRNLERSLSRGDNIEEGHFAERAWAGLLYPQVSMEEMNLLIALSDHVSDLWMMGTLVRH